VNPDPALASLFDHVVRASAAWKRQYARYRHVEIDHPPVSDRPGPPSQRRKMGLHANAWFAPGSAPILCKKVRASARAFALNDDVRIDPIER
jgi:hypothetical protein